MQDGRRDPGSAALLASALAQFATVGFDGASLQRIADDAGLSKSSVVYHFGSKEALLAAALRPAVDDLAGLVDRVGEDRQGFLRAFVDYLFAHRLAAAVLVNHGRALAGHAVIDEADALVRALAERLEPVDASDQDGVRFGVALSGVAFMLVAADRWSAAPVPDDRLRATLLEILGELVGVGA